ncbi:MAG: hypothetical protein MR364_04230 [Oscillospiraceae bacterium]|nr:hypothetical protein [Oscillospiraceae bacterium]
MSDKVKRLTEQNAKLEKELAEARQEIAELKERLEQSFKMKELGDNTELETLRKNLGDALSAEYHDFTSSNKTFNKDNFEANYAGLVRIFKILKRFGFTLE